VRRMERRSMQVEKATKANPKRVARMRWLLLMCGAATATVAALCVHLVGLPKPIRFDPTRYGAASDAILSGRIIPDPEGIITLPPHLQNLSMTGCAYLLRRQQQPLIFFPVSDGRDFLHPIAEDNWIGGYVFDADHVARKRGDSLPESWSLNGPYLEDGRARTAAPCSHPWDVVEQKAYGGGWYLAETFS
jgi:hypothetical protein